jgi:hypothetical protein
MKRALLQHEDARHPDVEDAWVEVQAAVSVERRNRHRRPVNGGGGRSQYDYTGDGQSWRHKSEDVNAIEHRRAERAERRARLTKDLYDAGDDALGEHFAGPQWPSPARAMVPGSTITPITRDQTYSSPIIDRWRSQRQSVRTSLRGMDHI